MSKKRNVDREILLLTVIILVYNTQFFLLDVLNLKIADPIAEML